MTHQVQNPHSRALLDQQRQSRPCPDAPGPHAATVARAKQQDHRRSRHAADLPLKMPPIDIPDEAILETIDNEVKTATRRHALPDPPQRAGAEPLGLHVARRHAEEGSAPERGEE